MTGTDEGNVTRRRGYWRALRWTAAAALLLTPLVMMQFSDEWHWTIGSFLFFGGMLAAFGLVYELAEQASRSRPYRAGVAVALLASFLTIWTTLVREDCHAVGFFMLVLAAGVGGFAAWFQPAGMARAMLGVAVMQALLGAAVATAPSTADLPDEPFRGLVFCGFFTAMWLLSAALFRTAARSDISPAGTG